MAVELDRIAIESAGADPKRLAAAIIRQLPGLSGAVPVCDIARALDIDEIRAERLNSLEGCLLTDRQKSYGSILVNANRPPRRRRYSVGHELGHFLNERHIPTANDGFRCTKEDMVRPAGSALHLRQEAEANTFAIELLAPERLIRAHLERPADLEHALAIARDQQISREAAVRRYVELHAECLAVVFSVAGRIRYIEKGEGFPGIQVWRNDPLPPIPPASRDGTELTTLDEADAGDWLTRPTGVDLFAQTLRQAEGYAITLLLAENGDSDDR